MKKETRLRISSLVKLLSLFIPVILLVSIVFPTYSIFGYPHDILTATDPYLYITITEKPLFIVLSDNYYPNSLKIGYIGLFVVEILSVICSLIFLAMFILGKNKISKILFFVSHCFLTTLCVFAISLFYKNPPILLISLVCLLISTGNLVLHIVFKLRKEKKR